MTSKAGFSAGLGGGLLAEAGVSAGLVGFGAAILAEGVACRGKTNEKKKTIKKERQKDRKKDNGNQLERCVAAVVAEQWRHSQPLLQMTAWPTRRFPWLLRGRCEAAWLALRQVCRDTT